MAAQGMTTEWARRFGMTCVVVLAWSAAGWAFAGETNDAPQSTGQASGTPDVPHFTPLTLLPHPQVVQAAQAYPGGMFLATHLLDEKMETEFATEGQGTDTFVAFDFGSAVSIAGIRHVDRQDVATIDTSELTFSDTADFRHVLARETVRHANVSGGTTVALFAQPRQARFVRWQVTQLNAAGHTCVGGRELRFFTSGAPDSAPHLNEVSIEPIPAVLHAEPQPMQPVVVTIRHVYVEPAELVLKVGHLAPVTLQVGFGEHAVPLELPLAAQSETLTLELLWGGTRLLHQQCVREPVRPWELYFLPHSHVDIGYTHVQTEVEQQQWEHLRQAMQIVRNTADYPPAARFKWNCEVLWAVDSFLRQASEEERQQFIQAVRDGSLHLDALYGNQLTALCRPEELVRLVDCAARIARQYDVEIDAAMISDVPGYTWGLVPALVQSGIHYLSIGPNHVHRIGGTLEEWGDRPFYWVSPSGQERLLCWMAGKAYSWFHPSRVGILARDSRPDPFFAYLAELEEARYPYDMVQIRYSIGGDNGPPDQELSEFVRTWNERYMWPRMTIATTRELMRAFEQRYGDRIPEVRGDFTPYWEDGAASSARETGLTRMAAERLVQAEVLWSLRSSDPFPDDEFSAAWREVLLYNEHTWGAHCSISEPDSPFTLSQWQIKQQFALEAERRSHDLLQRAGGQDVAPPGDSVVAVDVWNTTSWPRSDLVLCEIEVPVAGGVVRDMEGKVVPSEVTPRGHLAFLASEVPAFGAKRFLIESGTPAQAGTTTAAGHVLSNGRVRVELDPQSGTITSLRWQDVDHDFATAGGEGGLNSYRYVAGRDARAPLASRPHAMEVLTSGGLTAAVGIYADAPGSRQLISIVRIIEGLDRVDICNVIDKEPVLDKESVHFGFPFQVPGGVIRIDVPWGVIQPDVDQLPGACKNYLTVGRWVDVSNQELGITWSTLDAPLLGVGGIHVDVDEPFASRAWIKHLGPTQTIYSYVMNNYWETNYKASQEGMTTFRYSLRPHQGYDQAAATRFGIERSQPLVVVPVARDAPLAPSRLRVGGEGVIATSLKPSHDGQALMLRLFNAGANPAETSVEWSDPAPARVLLSSPREEPGPVCPDSLALPPLGIVTLRAELSPER